MILPKVPILDRLTSVCQSLWPAQLAESYTLADYGRFMREETFHCSARHARRVVVMHGQERLLKAARNSRAIVAFLHYGSKNTSPERRNSSSTTSSPNLTNRVALRQVTPLI